MPDCRAPPEYDPRRRRDHRCSLKAMVVQRGTHASMLAAGGPYAELVHAGTTALEGEAALGRAIGAVDTELMLEGNTPLWLDGLCAWTVRAGAVALFSVRGGRARGGPRLGTGSRSIRGGPSCGRAARRRRMSLPSRCSAPSWSTCHGRRPTIPPARSVNPRSSRGSTCWPRRSVTAGVRRARSRREPGIPAAARLHQAQLEFLAAVDRPDVDQTARRAIALPIASVERACDDRDVRVWPRSVAPTRARGTRAGPIPRSCRWSDSWGSRATSRSRHRLG